MLSIGILNKNLLRGLVLTNNLIGVLCRFKKVRVVVACDIEFYIGSITSVSIALRAITSDEKSLDLY